MMENYHNWLQSEGRSENTIARYLRILDDFKKWHKKITNQDEFDPRYVSAKDLQDWKRYLVTEAIYLKKEKNMDTGKHEYVPHKYSISSVNIYLVGIKPFFDYCIESEFIFKSPAVKLKKQKVQDDYEGDPRWLNRHEKNRLLFWLNNKKLEEQNRWRFTRNRAICFTGLHAGLRVSEIIDLESEDIHFHREYIHVRNGKGGKSRRIEMNLDLINALKNWLEERGNPGSEKLFISQKGGALSDNGITNMLKTLGSQSGIEGLTPHVLRHTFGHDLAEGGTRLDIIADLLGHSNVNYTRNYTRSSKDERKGANNLSGDR